MAFGKRLLIASDHGGFVLKSELVRGLRAEGFEVEDLGAPNAEPSDYPDFAHALGRRISDKTAERGILVCGTGVGISIAANRHAGVRAVCCSDVYTARLSRLHNHSNVLCLGERVVGVGLAWEIVHVWLSEGQDESPRHVRRVQKIEVL
jgi:ribose 5-phosphate isomerase B